VQGALGISDGAGLGHFHVYGEKQHAEQQTKADVCGRFENLRTTDQLKSENDICAQSSQTNREG
jgi:hypothetical protein